MTDNTRQRRMEREEGENEGSSCYSPSALGTGNVEATIMAASLPSLPRSAKTKAWKWPLPPPPPSLLLLATTLLLLPSPSSSTAVSGSPSDLTELCCTTEISARISDHAILANSRDRTLVRLYKTSAYNQMLVETYCMSLADQNLHITVHPRCVGQCRQVKEAQDTIVVDQHGNRQIQQVLVNSGCVFVPL